MFWKGEEKRKRFLNVCNEYNTSCNIGNTVQLIITFCNTRLGGIEYKYFKLRARAFIGGGGEESCVQFVVVFTHTILGKTVHVMFEVSSAVTVVACTRDRRNPRRKTHIVFPAYVSPPPVRSTIYAVSASEVLRLGYTSACFPAAEFSRLFFFIRSRTIPRVNRARTTGK